MTETDDRLAARTRRSSKAPARGKGLKIKRVFTTAGVHPYDEVAYLRFASVYRSFSSVADFEREIAELKERQSPSAPGPTSVPTGSPTAMTPAGS